jgi:hypothetical protein
VERRVVGTLAGAKADIGARAFLQHESEIFRAHGWLDVGLNQRFPDQADRRGRGGVGFRRGVDHTGITPHVFEIDRCAVGLCHALADLSHLCFHLVLDFGAQRPHRSAQHDVLRHYIPGVATMDLREADHGRL